MEFVTAYVHIKFDYNLKLLNLSPNVAINKSLAPNAANNLVSHTIHRTCIPYTEVEINSINRMDVFCAQVHAHA